MLAFQYFLSIPKTRKDLNSFNQLHSINLEFEYCFFLQVRLSKSKLTVIVIDNVDIVPNTYVLMYLVLTDDVYLEIKEIST